VIVLPAAVEVYGDMAAFASLRVPAWHDLGTVFDKPVSTSEMLSLAHLADWNLRFVNAQDAMEGYHFVTETNHIVRDNPFIDNRVDVLGTVGGRYKIFSNEEIFDFGDSLTNGRRRWETAGSINGGQTIFASLVSTDDLVLDPRGSADTIKRYILLTSSHNGSTKMIVKIVNTRVVCQNTLNIALREMGNEIGIRHTQGMATKLEDARKALGFVDLYDEVFEEEAKALFEADMTMVEFEKIVMDIFPQPEDNVRGRETKWNNRMDRILDLWSNASGSVENLPDNAWKGFQVITENNQWDRQIRKNGAENFLAAGAGFDKVSNDFRTDAFERFREFALSA
jgi:phage/plasmid-like protein (TIGR03299 family)